MSGLEIAGFIAGLIGASASVISAVKDSRDMSSAHDSQQSLAAYVSTARISLSQSNASYFIVRANVDMIQRFQLTQRVEQCIRAIPTSSSTELRSGTRHGRSAHQCQRRHHCMVQWSGVLLWWVCWVLRIARWTCNVSCGLCKP
jgi:hypothetical protein